MARVFQILGWAFVLVGIMLIGLMGIMVIDGPPLTEPAGAVWAKFDRYSLGQFQVFIQRILGLPDLWDDFVVPILQAPAWQPMGVLTFISFLLGAVLVFGSRNSRRRGIIHRSHSS